MIVVARINDKDDIVKRTSQTANGDVVSGAVHLQLFQPSEVVEARISPELWASLGNGADLAALIDKKTEFKIQFIERSFAGDGGKHVSFSGYHLLGVPSLDKKA